MSPGCGCPALVPNYCCLLPGDADASRDFNIGDVTFVVNFIFTSGTAPECYDEADADSSNDITIGDVTSMIAYIFGSGPAPSCGGRGF